MKKHVNNINATGLANNTEIPYHKVHASLSHHSGKALTATERGKLIAEIQATCDYLKSIYSEEDGL
jgi:hypothetical protein